MSANPRNSARLLLILSLLGGPSLAQATGQQARGQANQVSEAKLAELTRAMPALMDSGEVAGLAIAIVEDGQIRWSRGFGVRSRESGEPVDENTVFEAASLSKPVFAYAVLKLVDEGVIDLDRPLAEYRAYEDIEHDQRYRRITARMVLSHTSGFPNWRPREGRLTIGFEPGAKWSYSGEGFVYLQKVVEELSGEPLHLFMMKRVFEPLGMTRSSYIWDDRFAANVAVPHGADSSAREKQKPDGTGNAAASLHTTASDFARFLIAVIQGRDLSEPSARAMLTPQVEVNPGVTWGLGTGLEDSAAGRGFWHWGHNDGYRAFTIAYRDRDYGIVWFTNSSNGMTILEALLDRSVGGGAHPAVAHLNYEPYNSPSRLVRRTLEETIVERGVEATMRQYRELKTSRPAEAFNEFTLNALGYNLLRRDRTQDAIAIFRLNVEEYPKAWNPYDSLGEAYMAAGELKLAIKSYEKSLELNPDNTNGLAMLERIRAKLGEQDKKE